MQRRTFPGSFSRPLETRLSPENDCNSSNLKDRNQISHNYLTACETTIHDRTSQNRSSISLYAPFDKTLFEDIERPGMNTRRYLN